MGLASNLPRHSSKLSDDWTQPFEVDSKKVASPQARRVKMGLMKILVWTVVVLFIPLVVTVVAVVSRAGEVSETGQNQFWGQKAAASVFMRDWLAKAPMVEPVLLSADDVVPVEYELSNSARGRKTVDSYVAHFTIVDFFGTVWKASVQVVTDPQGVSKVSSLPSLTPVPPPSRTLDLVDSWPGLGSAGVSQAVERAVQDWAEKYGSGDPDALRQIMGDPDPLHWFAPLTGVSKIKASTLAATPIGAGEATVAVRVEFSVVWLGQPEPERDPAAMFSLDLRVEAADTASPKITAWGAPGSGPTLETYANAIDGQGRVVASASAPPSPPGTGSASPFIQPTR